MKTIYLVLFCLIGGILTLSAQPEEYSFMETYDFGSTGNFGLSTSDGFIYVYPAEDNQISVYYIVRKGDRFMDINREKLEEEIEIEITGGKGNLDIKLKNKRNYGWSSWKDRYNVSCEVYVPVGTACKLRSSDGDIKLKDLQADQTCRTSDGDVLVLNVSGNVDARTSDGDVILEEINGSVHLISSDGDLKAIMVDGDATLETSDGDIKMTAVSGIMEAITSDGDIRFIDCAGSLRAVTSDGDVYGNLARLKGKLRVSTSDGDIDVTIPEGTGISLKMKGEDLEIPRIEITGKISEHSIQGDVNGGGIPVELTTSDGSVSLAFE